MTDENPQPENRENAGAHTPDLREMGAIVRDLTVGGLGVGVLPVAALTGVLATASAVAELAEGRTGKAAALGAAGVTLVGLAVWGSRKLYRHFYGAAAQPEAPAEIKAPEKKESPGPAAVAALASPPSGLSPK